MHKNEERSPTLWGNNKLPDLQLKKAKMKSAVFAVVIAAFQLGESFAPHRSSLHAAGKVYHSSTTACFLFPWGNRRRESDDSHDDLNKLQQEQHNTDEQQPSSLQNSRRSFLSATAVSASLLPLRSSAADTATPAQSDKLLNLSNEELKKIILSDIVDKSFLVSADITRSVYDESATFTDESKLVS